MSVNSNRISSMLRTVSITGLLFIALGLTSVAEAAEGCGLGRHLTVYGRCIMNYPGPWATVAPEHPGCWRNWRGNLRCY